MIILKTRIEIMSGHTLCFHYTIYTRGKSAPGSQDSQDKFIHGSASVVLRQVSEKWNKYAELYNENLLGHCGSARGLDMNDETPLEPFSKMPLYMYADWKCQDNIMPQKAMLNHTANGLKYPDQLLHKSQHQNTMISNFVFTQLSIYHLQYSSSWIGTFLQWKMRDRPVKNDTFQL